MKYIIGAIVLLVISSCGKDNNSIDNFFEFNLDNSYRIENIGTEFKTLNAYEPENIPEFNIYLTDSEIGTELTASCCGSPWDYLVNPTTEVHIYFAKNKNELSSGIYTYNKNAADNDFKISINNQMTFNSNNKLTYLNNVANTYSDDSDIRIEHAQIELLLGQVTFEINYKIETVENKRIIGSYTGSLENFTYNLCNADCD